MDEGVSKNFPLLEEQIRNYLRTWDIQVQVPELILIPGGEQAKNDPGNVRRILESIEHHKVDRHSYLMAIGGGAILDLAGFSAAIAHRGIRHIRIPTTVLSQNDSGMGVKNGINFFGKKNFLGAFVPPFAVFNDRNFLLTLPKRDWLAGISEAIKVALIRDGDFFQWIEGHRAGLCQRNGQLMENLIFRCARLHLQHIAQGDPFESGTSRPLDFGHWSAHKLESLTHYELRHGEAVSIGIALDSYYSFLLGWLNLQDLDRILSLLYDLELPIFHPSLKENSLYEGMEEFREHLGGEITILLLRCPGIGEEVHSLDGALLRKAIGGLEEFKTKKSPQFS